MLGFQTKKAIYNSALDILYNSVALLELHFFKKGKQVGLINSDRLILLIGKSRDLL